MADSEDKDDLNIWESPGVSNGGFAWVHAGVRVKICGLQKKPELNGKVGKATAKAASGRWGVELEQGEPGVAVLEVNLCRPEEPLPEDTGGSTQQMPSRRRAAIAVEMAEYGPLFKCFDARYMRDGSGSCFELVSKRS